MFKISYYKLTNPIKPYIDYQAKNRMFGYGSFFHSYFAIDLNEVVEFLGSNPILEEFSKSNVEVII